MKHFLKLVETANQIGIWSVKNKKMFRVSDEEEQHFFEIIKHCRPLIFSDDNFFNANKMASLYETYKDTNGEFELNSAPFPVFSIEVSGKGSAFLIIDGGKCLCIVCGEVRPGVFILYSLYMLNGNYGVHQSGGTSLASKELLAHYINRINTQDSGIEAVNIKTKIGRGKSKCVHKINSVIHITGERKDYDGQYGIREIDWSHRFEVRGHWRKVDKIGKDRLGNYCVDGYTWVSDHVRGPEDLPLVRKQRVIHASKNSSASQHA